MVWWRNELGHQQRQVTGLASPENVSMNTKTRKNPYQIHNAVVMCIYVSWRRYESSVSGINQMILIAS